jgi:hypothetical protein
VGSILHKRLIVINRFCRIRWNGVIPWPQSRFERQCRQSSCAIAGPVSYQTASCRTSCALFVAIDARFKYWFSDAETALSPPVMNDWLRVPLAGDALSFFTCLCTGNVLRKKCINPVQCCSSGWSEKFPSKGLVETSSQTLPKPQALEKKSEVL